MWKLKTCETLHVKYLNVNIKANISVKPFFAYMRNFEKHVKVESMWKSMWNFTCEILKRENSSKYMYYQTIFNMHVKYWNMRNQENIAKLNHVEFCTECENWIVNKSSKWSIGQPIEIEFVFFIACCNQFHNKQLKFQFTFFFHMFIVCANHFISHKFHMCFT